MPGPMGKFMQGGAVIARRVLKRLFRRQMDAVRRRSIERAVTLVVRDLRSGVCKDAFTAMSDFELGRLRPFKSGNAIDLFGVEDRIDTVDESALAFFGRLTTVRLAGFSILLFRLGLHLPKFDVGALFALSDLPAILGSLLVGHPTWIFIATRKSGRHKVNGIAASIGPVSRGIEGHPSRLPRFLPRCDTLLKHFYDGIGDLLAVVALCGHRG